ncbi:hypothetical protein HDU93_005198 [Gonapodya sp. JEL0774]|nr:hypothetical protein HDU93_005198 [Gonapodya sp. JEL0774]
MDVSLLVLTALTAWSMIEAETMPTKRSSQLLLGLTWIVLNILGDTLFLAIRSLPSPTSSVLHRFGIVSSLESWTVEFRLVYALWAVATFTPVLVSWYSGYAQEAQPEQVQVEKDSRQKKRADGRKKRSGKNPNTRVPAVGEGFEEVDVDHEREPLRRQTARDAMEARLEEMERDLELAAQYGRTLLAENARLLTLLRECALQQISQSTKEAATTPSLLKINRTKRSSSALVTEASSHGDLNELYAATSAPSRGSSSSSEFFTPYSQIAPPIINDVDATLPKKFSPPDVYPRVSPTQRFRRATAPAPQAHRDVTKEYLHDVDSLHSSSSSKFRSSELESAGSPWEHTRSHQRPLTAARLHRAEEYAVMLEGEISDMREALTSLRATSAHHRRRADLLSRALDEARRALEEADERTSDFSNGQVSVDHVDKRKKLRSVIGSGFSGDHGLIENISEGSALSEDIWIFPGAAVTENHAEVPQSTGAPANQLKIREKSEMFVVVPPALPLLSGVRQLSQFQSTESEVLADSVSLWNASQDPAESETASMTPGIMVETLLRSNRYVDPVSTDWTIETPHLPPLPAILPIMLDPHLPPFPEQSQPEQQIPQATGEDTSNQFELQPNNQTSYPSEVPPIAHEFCCELPSVFLSSTEALPANGNRDRIMKLGSSTKVLTPGRGSKQELERKNEQAPAQISVVEQYGDASFADAELPKDERTSMELNQSMNGRPINTYPMVEIHRDWTASTGTRTLADELQHIGMYLESADAPTLAGYTPRNICGTAKPDIVSVPTLRIRQALGSLNAWFRVISPSGSGSHELDTFIDLGIDSELPDDTSLPPQMGLRHTLRAPPNCTTTSHSNLAFPTPAELAHNTLLVLLDPTLADVVMRHVGVPRGGRTWKVGLGRGRMVEIEVIGGWARVFVGCVGEEALTAFSGSRLSLHYAPMFGIWLRTQDNFSVWKWLLGLKTRLNS